MNFESQQEREIVNKIASLEPETKKEIRGLLMREAKLVSCVWLCKQKCHDSEKVD